MSKKSQIKVLQFSLLLAVMFSCKTNQHLAKEKKSEYDVIQSKDTISGMFLFEVNVPLRCYINKYTDGIEQGGSLIFYSDGIKNTNIDNLYKKGIFNYTYDGFIRKYSEDTKITLSENKRSIHAFAIKANNLMLNLDSLFDKECIHDKTGILTFKKVRAKMVVVDLGNLSILVPDMKNFICCYSSKRRLNHVYFIKEFINFKIY